MSEFRLAQQMDSASSNSPMQIQLGLENQPARMFVVVESRLLLQFLKTFGAGSELKKQHPNVHIVWVVLPINFAFFG